MSSKPPALREPEPAIADTVVLRYFLLVERTDLLVRVLGTPIMVSRIVYDPEDAGNEGAMSEMVRSIHVQRRRALDPKRGAEERDRANLFADRLTVIHGLHDDGHIAVVGMTESELDTYGRLTDRDHAARFGLLFPLDDGEAASLAIALEREWVLATDDTDALKAMRKVRRRHPYQRVRKTLIEAAGEGLVERREANAIHASMRDFGFWDRTTPFPEMAL